MLWGIILSENTNILIVGANFRNKGAAAMAQTAVNELEDADITISSIFDDDLRHTDQYEVIKHVRILELVLKEILHVVNGGIFRPKSLLKRWNRKFSQLNRYLGHVHQADVVVDLSGYALTDNFGTFRIWSWIEILLLSKVISNRFVMLPQSVGPLSKWRNRALIRAFVPLADFRSVRGSVSRRWMHAAGVTDVETYPDTAFLFEPATEERGQEIVSEIGLDDTRYVTIVPNARLYERWDKYEEHLCEIVSHINDIDDCEILVLPHEYTDGGHIDDRYVIEQLREHDAFKDTITVQEEYSARELKRIIGYSELLIGSRLHSTVAGVSMDVPTLAIGWSEKYYEILEWVDAEDDVWLPENYDSNEVLSNVTNILGRNEVGEFYRQLDRIKEDAKSIFLEL